MRSVVQRVSRAAVRVDGKTVGQIGRGLLVLVGLEKDDGEAQVDWQADKIAGLRVFEDAAGKMNLGLSEVQGAVLAVSQFTLAGSIDKGRRPGFDNAMAPEPAARLFERFVARLRAQGVATETGVFRAMMEVELVNDGPVTFVLESRSPRPS